MKQRHIFKTRRIEGIKWLPHFSLISFFKEKKDSPCLATTNTHIQQYFDSIKVDRVFLVQYI